MFKHCLIVEDQAMFAEALQTSLVSMGLVAQCTVANSLGAAEAALRRARYDIVVSDLLFPEGTANGFIGSALAAEPRPRVIVVTSLSDNWHLQSVLTHSVDAVVPKGELLSSLRRRIEEMMPATSKQVVTKREEIERIEKFLSRREKEVVSSLGAGATNQEIAEQLGLSVRTVETHRRNISKKLGIFGNELVRAAVHFRDFVGP